MTDIILPRQDENGDFYISYSQYSSWKSKKSFNLGIDGREEYILSYFFKERFPDAGWALFGQQVEDYVCEKKGSEFFSERERKVMDQIDPLGVFQEEIKWYILPNVYILGYIDDRLEDYSKIRDYKTASQSSKARYYKDDYTQLDIYGGYVQSKTGLIPQAEVCIIERQGNCFGMRERRDLLSVGNEVWYHPITITPQRIEKVKADILTTIFEVSSHYKHFLNLNK